MARKNRPAKSFDTELFTGRVIACKRLTNTVNGGPRYRLTIDVNSATGPLIAFTKPDTTYVLAITWTYIEGKTVVFSLKAGDKPVITNLEVRDN